MWDTMVVVIVRPVLTSREAGRRVIPPPAELPPILSLSLSGWMLYMYT